MLGDDLRARGGNYVGTEQGQASSCSDSLRPGNDPRRAGRQPVMLSPDSGIGALCGGAQDEVGRGALEAFGGAGRARAADGEKRAGIEAALSQILTAWKSLEIVLLPLAEPGIRG